MAALPKCGVLAVARGIQNATLCNGLWFFPLSFMDLTVSVNRMVGIFACYPVQFLLAVQRKHHMPELLCIPEATASLLWWRSLGYDWAMGND